jgi:hypothetical protein
MKPSTNMHTSFRALEMRATALMAPNRIHAIQAGRPVAEAVVGSVRNPLKEQGLADAVVEDLLQLLMAVHGPFRPFASTPKNVRSRG